ncbi:MAG TPA: transglutaminase domain-containing protein [Spirochaetales bacterium]|nr:transglutaminase domain-containing protein [Spirochaetales bacterium]HRY54240.1 transglutaminase domain-containing protein [Spirochaetia bacterium]HRZ64867.1 transglutaminase domain-containing protein [Spirochaetia bacterium]
MSLELPPSSSLFAERARPPSAPPRLRSALKRLAIAAASCLAAALGAYLLYGLLSRPRIDRIDPAVGEPGQVIRIEGRNFGAERGESRIEADGVSPTASSYLSWSDEELSLRLPAAVDSGLIYLVTRHGRSNPKLFMNRARLPIRAENQLAGRSGPFIASASSEGGPVGSLLVLSGLDFGASREGASVQFSWSVDAGQALPGPQAAVSSVENAETDFGYELWSDKEIRVRVPDGAASGAVTVLRGKDRGNGVFFRVTEAPGIKRYTDRRTYSLSHSISVNKIKASGENELYLWTPEPVETAYQRAAALSREPAPLVPDYRGTAIFRFKDLAAGSELSVRQSYLVQVYAVETEIAAERIALKPKDPPALMAHYLAPDGRVPSDAPEVQALARRIVGGERNPWRATRLVWDWLVRNLAYNPAREQARAQDALASKSADAHSYALLACALLRAAGVPSLPVAGYLVEPSRKAVRHYWVEVYLYGLGWVPLDPVLGSGAEPGVEVLWKDRSRYLGSQDNRHIAFSRGVAVLAPMAPKGRRVAKDRRWSFQSFYEESAGRLEAYSSFWGDVEVTGMY